MLFEEAQWVGKTLLKYVHAGQTAGNIGSSDLKSRTVTQPQMQTYIFGPLEEKNVKVLHVDLKEAEGVDLIGDLTEKAFIDELKKINFDIILCCNLLEHLADRQPIIDALNDIVPKNGYLLMTVPYHYPHHRDPIDTMYRPTVNELVAHFPNFKLIEGLELEAKRVAFKNGEMVLEKNYFQRLIKTKLEFGWKLFRCLLPFYHPFIWRKNIRDLYYMFRTFKVTCVILQKEG